MQNNKLRKLYKEFYKLNYPYWNNSNLKDRKDSDILVFVAGNLAIPLIEIMLFAKKLQESSFCNIIICFTGKIPYGSKLLYKSFSISKFIKIPKTNIFIILKTLTYFFKAFSCRRGDDLLDIKIDSNFIPVGEEIYDWILRDSKLLSLSHLSIKSRIKILVYIFHYFSFAELTKKQNVKFFISSCADYLYSAYAKVCQKKRIPMLTPEYMRGYTIQHNESEGFKFLSNCFITTSLFNKIITKYGCQAVEETVKKHFLGLEYNNGSMAFRNKRFYTKEDLLNRFRLKDNKKVVVITAHVFSDRSHYSFDMIFKDYYDWLVKTIEILANVDKYHVFVKEHPSSVLYGEEGSLTGILKKIGVTNVYAIPSDLSTRCLFDFVDCFVTCCGTIGLEAACFGIPVVTASKGYYYGYGLDNNCSDYKSYKECLENIEFLKGKSDKIELAKKLLTCAIYEFELHPVGFMKDLSLIGDKFCDDYTAMQILNQSIKKGSPKDVFYNSQLDNIIIYDDSCIPTKMSNDS